MGNPTPDERPSPPVVGQAVLGALHQLLSRLVAEGHKSVDLAVTTTAYRVRLTVASAGRPAQPPG